MRKLILNVAVTLDGMIEGPNGEYDWCIMDEEADFPGFLDSVDAIFYGRKSYELFGGQNPDAFSSDAEQALYQQTAGKKKYVFSRTPKELGSQATLVTGDIAAQVKQVKSEPGKSIWLFGGADLGNELVRLGLVDEFQLAVHPVILGAGKPLFSGLTERSMLQLTSSRVFASGVVQLIYRLA